MCVTILPYGSSTHENMTMANSALGLVINFAIGLTDRYALFFSMDDYLKSQLKSRPIMFTPGTTISFDPPVIRG